jgi:hypothetical protein
MTKLIVFLIRKKLGLKKYQNFQFNNQKSEVEFYWFTETNLMKMRNDGVKEEAHVSLNWLLDKNCRVHSI